MGVAPRDYRPPSNECCEAAKFLRVHSAVLARMHTLREKKIKQFCDSSRGDASKFASPSIQHFTSGSLHSVFRYTCVAAVRIVIPKINI